ncbi:hypothetical protein AZI86_06745 [Bdellovibrio bacteriovorus]|uniref:Peptidase S74 domain-containing protein n=1 Tax=Bdellovibrio bacteriovorus TaxID=959 RepID=A0A150WQT5_BDEBC|nr:tail fiber domain-containing protein [Bdellovibrio bacteriovorus]KYG66736.1 hypothetical protein AZI86_06745 [Bdellovibrio bacteriovorus]
MQYKKIFLSLLLSVAGVSRSAEAVVGGTSNALTYQGRIIKSDGSPLQYSNVSFIFQITDPAGTCLIYQEQVTGYNMANSAGVFDVPIGAGTIVWPNTGSFTVIDSFNNAKNYTCGSCSGSSCVAGSSTYTASSADGRMLRVQFYDGNGWKLISPDTAIRSVPFAGYAQSSQKLGAYGASEFVLKSAINSGTNCSGGSFLTWNASSQTFGCSGVSGASGGTVTDLTVSSPLSVVNGTSTPHITIQAASNSQNGYLTSTDWTTFNNKIGTSFTFAGDISGNASAISVDKIKNVSISNTAPTLNQVLQFDGSKWTATTLSTTTSGSAGGDLSGFYPNPSVASVGTSTAANIHSAEILANSATNTNTASTIVKRDSSGNFTAGNITASLTGAASLNVLKTGDSISGNLVYAANTGNVYTAGSGGNTVTLQGPSTTIGTSYILRLPTSPASSTGQALVSDTSGNLSWQSLNTGAVTSVTATAPLVSSGGSAPVLSLTGLTGLGTANQILAMNSGATAYEYKTVSGTSNQIVVNNGANSITLSTPQNIHTGASPTFSALTLSSLTTAGFVKNNASGVLSGGNAISLGADITGTLPVANGGTGATSFANYSVIASNSNGTSLSAVSGSTSGSILQYGVTGPIFSTASYPSTTAANQLLYSSANNVVGGLATANSSVLTTNSSGVPSFSALSSDLFSQYARLAGRSGGQTLYGGTSSGNSLTLDSSSNATKGNIVLNPSGGNVGIGTPSPSAKLETNLNSTAATTSTGIYSLLNLNPAANQSAGVVNSSILGYVTIDVDSMYNIGEVDAVKGSINDNSDSSSVALSGIRSDVRSSTMRTVTEVNSFISSGDLQGPTVTNYNGIKINDSISGATVSNWYGLYVKHTVNTSGSIANRYGVYLAAPTGSATNDFAFYSANNKPSYFSGTLGIGTTSPSYTLDVNGSVRGTSAYVNSSDVRYKRHISNIENALDKILQIRGVTFDWRNNEFPEKRFKETRDMGVIAQEIEKVFPEAVVTDREGYKSVAYPELVAPLINATKELYKKWLTDSAEIHRGVASNTIELSQLKSEKDNLKDEVQKLKNENAVFRARLEKLEKMLVDR